MFQSDHVSLSHHDMHSSSMHIIVERADVYQQITNISWVFYSPRVIINMGVIRKVPCLGCRCKNDLLYATMTFVCHIYLLSICGDQKGSKKWFQWFPHTQIVREDFFMTAGGCKKKNGILGLPSYVDPPVRLPWIWKSWHLRSSANTGSINLNSKSESKKTFKEIPSM